MNTGQNSLYGAKNLLLKVKRDLRRQKKNERTIE
jgi:hypothetical protein